MGALFGPRFSVANCPRLDDVTKKNEGTSVRGLLIRLIQGKSLGSAPGLKITRNFPNCSILKRATNRGALCSKCFAEMN